MTTDVEMLQWQIGSVTVTRVVEMEVAGGTRFILPDATRDVCLDHSWMQPHFMDKEGNLIMSIHSLVVDTGERRIIVDTCLGNDKEREIPAWNRLQTDFLEDLTAAGYPPDTIDTVMCTHLHVDHVGWNTRLVDGEWVPTFANARYLMARPDWCSSADSDRAQGEATRRELLDQLSGDDADILVIGTHFATPTSGHVRATADGSHWLEVGR